MKNIFNVLAEGHEVFWSFSHDDHESDQDFIKRVDAQIAAEEWFNDYAEERFDGHDAEDWVDLVQYWFSDDGEKNIIRTDTIDVAYEYYHGDFAEHNTHWGL